MQQLAYKGNKTVPSYQDYNTIKISCVANFHHDRLNTSDGVSG